MLYYEKKMVRDPIQSTFNDLKLYEQNSYCYKYLKDNNPDIEESVIQSHSEIASASFRQASEYYNAAINTSIRTSPLLYSYAMNNLLKGVCYLKSFDNEILDGFGAHGFKVENRYLKEDALESKITFMKRKGAVHSLLKLYNNDLEAPQDIYLYKLLRHIPNIDKFYYKSVGSISLIATQVKNGDEEYILNGSNINAESKNIIQGFHFMLSSNPQHDICSGYLTVKTEQLIRNKVFTKDDIFYKYYLNIPEEFQGGLKSINVSFYCYLLIMSYGMMVRYNPNIWEKYIDKKTSQYGTLIELSIYNSVLNFYFQMHNLLFNFYYEDNTYSELDIKRIINESTPDIMNNITKKIKDQNIQYGKYDYLPWRENVR